MTNDEPFYPLTILLEAISIPYAIEILNEPTENNIENVLEKVFIKIKDITGDSDYIYTQIILYTLAAHLKQSRLDVYEIFLVYLYDDDTIAIEEVDSEVNDILNSINQ